MSTSYIGELREQYIALLKQKLKPSRFWHTLRTEAMAVTLALRFGESPAKAQEAALLHDLLKNISIEENEELMSKYNVSCLPEEVNLLHGRLAACYIRHELGVADEDVINAVNNHTAGRSGMSRLEKIIYLADLIEEGRSYYGVEKLRQLAEEDLDEAVFAACSQSICYLHKRGVPILGGTMELYNEFAIKRKGEEL